VPRGKRNDAFYTLAEPILDRLFYTARDMTGNVADAEDLTQEAILKGLRSFADFEPGSDFKAWMFRILTNGIIDHFRHRSRVPTVSLTEESPCTPQSVVQLASVDADIVEGALRALEPERRMAVILVELQGFTIGQAAEMTGWPAGTVASRLARGRDDLRRLLERLA